MDRRYRDRPTQIAANNRDVTNDCQPASSTSSLPTTTTSLPSANYHGITASSHPLSRPARTASPGHPFPLSVHLTFVPTTPPPQTTGPPLSVDCAIRYRTVPPTLTRSSPFNFMQLGPIEISTLAQPTSASLAPQPSNQHGFQQLHPVGPASGSSLPPQGPIRGGSVAGLNASQLEERLCGLNQPGPERPVAPGHRILEYENALTPSTPRQALGFKVVRRAHPTEGGAQLADFPNGLSDRWPARALLAVFGY